MLSLLSLCGLRAFAVSLALMCGTVSAAARDVAVVANKGTAQTGLSAGDLTKICKAQTTKWPDGKPITVVMKDPKASDMKVAVDKIYGMSPHAVNALIDTVNHGHTNRPGIVVVKTDDDVIKKVQSTPGALGLVDIYSIRSGVDVIRIGGKLPLEAGYALHGN